MVATDGHRLAFARTTLETELPRQEVVLPRKAVIELSKLLRGEEAPIRIALLGESGSFRFGSVELVTKVVDGKFPDYGRVIPTGHRNIITARSTGAAASTAARGHSFERQVSRRALGADEGQPASVLLQ